MTTDNRRYDIDWLRVIAIGLLLLYHTAICLQSWGIMIGFITSDNPWPALWTPMAMLNVWRIPLLFFVSGMGVYFATVNKSWKQLLAERARRILVPFVFGIFAVVPVHIYISQIYYGRPLSYSADPAHLWFLGNIFAYVIILLPLIAYCKKHEAGRVVTFIKKVFRSPLSLLLVIAAFIAEALLVNPIPYELYAMTWHGFFLGLLAFFFGFCFVLAGPPFWGMLLRWRWLFIAAAAGLYMYRLLQVNMQVPNVQLVVESNCWVFTVFAFGHKYLNRSSKALHWLSGAAYPVYIIHMVFLFLACALIFPLHLNAYLSFALVLLCTFTGCFAFYAFIIKRINIIRPLFGLKMIERGAGKAIAGKARSAVPEI